MVLSGQFKDLSTAFPSTETGSACIFYLIYFLLNHGANGQSDWWFFACMYILIKTGRTAFFPSSFKCVCIFHFFQWRVGCHLLFHVDFALFLHLLCGGILRLACFWSQPYRDCARCCRRSMRPNPAFLQTARPAESDLWSCFLNPEAPACLALVS